MDKTVYILEDRKIRVEWTILKGTSPVREDFRRALVKVFLIGNCEKYLLEATADRGTLMIDIPEGLEPGLYSLEAIWVKNAGHPGRHDRDLCRSMKQDLFAITEFEEEATNLPEGTVVLRAKSSTATYGYDGLSSYELAVLRGEWNGTEGEWLKHQRYVSVLDGRGDSEVDTMSQKSITEELVKHDTAIEGANKEIDTAQTDIKNLNDEMDEVQDRLAYIPKESFLSSEPACDYHTEDNQDELTVSRAIKDRFGRIIDEHYVTRETVKDYTQEVVDGSKLEIQPGSVQPEDLSPAVQQMIESAAAQPGHITNLPDEEDLTVTEHNTLQFKDREYNPYNYSGMGKVYLRKHIVNGTNMLTQHMMRKPNTIYVIRYDYCLGGGTIEVPEGCVLEFDGGTLRNGKIILNDSLLLGNPQFYCTLSGTVINDVINYSWYAENTLKRFREFLKLSNRYKSNTIYRITRNIDLNKETLIVPANTTLDFQGGSINNGEIDFGDKGLSYIKGNVDTKSVTMYGNYQPYNRVQRDVTINDFGKNALAELFLTYVKHTDEFVYGGHNAAFNPKFDINKQFEINCSTFSLLMAAGIPYENSKYAGGNNETNGTGYWGYKDLINWYSIPNPNLSGDEALKYSHQLAQHLNNLGYTMKNIQLDELETGDILFYSLSDNNTGVHPYLSIDHSAIFAYRQNDNKYCVWEIQNAGPTKAFYLNSYYYNNIKLVARIPRVGGRGLSPNNIAFNPYDVISNTSGTLLKSLNVQKTLNAYKYYTAILKLDFEEGDTAYPRIVRGNDVLATYDNFRERPKDGYYVLPFYYHEDIKSVTAQIVTRVTGKTVRLTEAFVFEGFITPYNDRFNPPIFYNNSLDFERVEDGNILSNPQVVTKLPNGYRLRGEVVVADDTSLKEESLLIAKIGGIKIDSSTRYIGNVISSYNKPGIVFINTNNEFRLVNTYGGKYQFYDILLLTEDLVFS